MWLFIITTIICNARISSSEEIRYMSYGDFIEETRKGNIVSVEIEQFSKIEGIIKEGDSTIPFQTYHQDPNNDILLLDLLKTKGVAISIKGEEKERYNYLSFYSMYTLLLPIAMLILLILINKRVKNIEKKAKSYITSQ